MGHDTRNKTVREVHRLTCDSCGKTVTKDVEHWEFREFVRIRKITGYGSIFDDSSIIEADLCQTCVQSLLGGVLRVFPLWSPIVNEISADDEIDVVDNGFMDSIE